MKGHRRNHQVKARMIKIIFFEIENLEVNVRVTGKLLEEDGEHFRRCVDAPKLGRAAYEIRSEKAGATADLEDLLWISIPEMGFDLLGVTLKKFDPIRSVPSRRGEFEVVRDCGLRRCHLLLPGIPSDMRPKPLNGKSNQLLHSERCHAKFVRMEETQLHAKRLSFLETCVEGVNVRARCEQLYLPVYNWCLGQLHPGRTIVIGVNAPQGGGKTTLTRVLCELLEAEGRRAATLSIDDFYLTRAEQVLLASDNTQNPYLQSRGYPGTHDLLLGSRVLKRIRQRQGRVRIPRYDKSRHSGKGDRFPEEEWGEVQLPLDLVFFEGWMLGFRAVDENELRDPALRDINERLRAYTKWWDEVDAWIVLKPQDEQFVVDWRVEAEERMKASAKTGMSEAEVREYVKTFLPAYQLYLPGLEAPDGRPELVIEIGRDRLPLAPGNQ